MAISKDMSMGYKNVFRLVTYQFPVLRKSVLSSLVPTHNPQLMNLAETSEILLIGQPMKEA